MSLYKSKCYIVGNHVTAQLYSRARHIDPSLVLVQPRKTHPFITESLLMGRKESKQTNKSIVKHCPAKGTSCAQSDQS